MTASPPFARVAVVGATGPIGRSVIREFTRLQQPVRAISRSMDNLRRDFETNTNVQRFAADAEDAVAMAEALRGCDAVITCYGVNYTEFKKLPSVMRTIVHAAETHGVRKAIQVTNIYPYGLPQQGRVTESHPLQPCSKKGQWRLDEENVLKTSKLPWVVLRLPDFFGPGAQNAYAYQIVEAARADKRADLLAPSQTPHQFVYVDDVGPVLAKLLAHDVAREVIHFSGSGDISVEAFARLAYKAAKKPYRARQVGKGVLRAMGLFMPLMRELVEMHYLQSTPVMLDDSRLAALLGEVKRTPYEAGIEAMLKG